MTTYDALLVVRDTLAYTTMGLMLGSLILSAVGLLLLVPPFDRVSGVHARLLAGERPSPGRFVRLVQYATAIAWPRYVQSDKAGYLLYTTFPFREHATALHRGFSMAFSICWPAFIAVMFVFAGIDMALVDDADQMLCPIGDRFCSR